MAVMQNHLHLICRVLPQWADTWTPEEIMRRWKTIWPGKREPSGEGAQFQREVIAALAADKKRVRKTCKRRATLGEFMRALKEPIARDANREDNVTGAFWEGRYKAQPLLDDSAVLAATVYVDLNPIRAAVADTPETSNHTSAAIRIRARQAKERLEALDHNLELSRKGVDAMTAQQQEMRAKEIKSVHIADWLAPLASLKHAVAGPKVEPAPTSTLDAPGSTVSKPSLVPEHLKIRPALPLSLDEYLDVLDWTGREIRESKRGHIPEHIAPILTRLEIDCNTWLQTVLNFGSLFYRVAGKIESIREAAKRLGRRWLKGVVKSQSAFVSKVG
jgi:hypothetical protein